jgi:hypothetical protein
LLALGSILVGFGRSYGLVFWSIAWFVAVVGAVVSLGVVAGRLPVGYVQFDPPGITIGGRRWSFTIPWDRVARLPPGGMDLPLLMRALERYVADPSSRSELARPKLPADR